MQTFHLEADVTMIMTDDLMDFSEGDENDDKFVEEHAENTTENVPGLVQSPVIVNSILKQSSKECSLIQLNIAVPKPEKGKLKVHFGVNSVLQTPETTPVKKQVIISSPTIHFEGGYNDAEYTSDKKEGWRQHTHFIANQDHLDYTHYARELLTELILNLPFTEDLECSKTNADSCSEDNILEDFLANVQVEEMETKGDKIEQCSSADLILFEAEELLKTIHESSSICFPSNPMFLSVRHGVNYNTKAGQATLEQNYIADEVLGMKALSSELTTTVVKKNIGNCIFEDMLGKDHINCMKFVGIAEIKINEKHKLPEFYDLTDEISTKNEDNELVPGKVMESNGLDKQSKSYIKSFVDESALKILMTNSHDIDPQQGIEVAFQNNLKNKTPQIDEMEITNKAEINKCEISPLENYQMLNNKDEKTTNEGCLSADKHIEEVDKAPVKKMFDSAITLLNQNPAVVELNSVLVDNTENSQQRMPLLTTSNLNFDDLNAFDPLASKEILTIDLELQTQHKLIPNSDSTDKKSTDIQNEKEFFKTFDPLTCCAIDNNESNVLKYDLSLEHKKAQVKDETPGVAENEINACDKVETKCDFKTKKIQFEEGSFVELDQFKSKFQIRNTPSKIMENTAPNISVLSVSKSLNAVEKDSVKDLAGMVVEVQVKVQASESTVSTENGENHSLKETQLMKDVTTQSSSLQKASSEKPGLTMELKSPPLQSKGLYDLDSLHLDVMNPCLYSKKIANTPELDKLKTEKKSNICTMYRQINSLEADKAAYKEVVADIDPFKCNANIWNSPVCVIDRSAELSKNIKDCVPHINVAVQNNDKETVSEVKKTSANFDFEGINVKIPISQILNSHNKPADINMELDLACFDSNNLMPNSALFESNNLVPSSSVAENNAQHKHTVAFQMSSNDPLKARTLSKNRPIKDVYIKRIDFDTDKSVGSKQMALEAQSSKLVAENNKDIFLTNFVDSKPFQSTEKIPNTAECNKFEVSRFACKSTVGNTPMKECFEMNAPLPATTETEKFNSLMEWDYNVMESDEFEVQGITKRSDDIAHITGQFGEIEESQFVAASQVFNDTAAWEMLEQFGNTTINTKELALSRISLYVKFDPLVNAAPANPRRVSMRMSHLEKIKEYGLDDTLLLLGTPPKKRRQSINTSLLRYPLSVPKASSETQSTIDKKGEPVISAPGSVDLILAYSPAKKNEAFEEENNPLMFLLKETESDLQEGLFQELKYTDADMRQWKTDMRLAIQGELISKEKEICKKEEQWRQREAVLLKKIQVIRDEYDELMTAFSEAEQMVLQIAAEREKTKKMLADETAEKNQAVQDIQALETAFSALLGRFERSKSVLISMQQNEEVMKKYVAEYQEKLKKMDEQLHTSQKMSEEKVTRLQQELDKNKQLQESDRRKSDAQLKLMQMKIDTFESTMKRKDADMKRLTEIVDNLIANSAH